MSDPLSPQQNLQYRQDTNNFTTTYVSRPEVFATSPLVTRQTSNQSQIGYLQNGYAQNATNSQTFIQGPQLYNTGFRAQGAKVVNLQSPTLISQNPVLLGSQVGAYRVQSNNNIQSPIVVTKTPVLVKPQVNRVSYQISGSQAAVRSSIRQDPIQVFRASGPPLPPLQSTVIRNHTSIQKSYAYNTAVVSQSPVQGPTIYQSVVKKLDPQRQSRKSLYEGRGYTDVKKGCSPCCLALLGLLGLAALLTGLFFLIRGINADAQPTPVARTNVDYIQSNVGKRSNQSSAIIIPNSNAKSSSSFSSSSSANLNTNTANTNNNTSTNTQTNNNVNTVSKSNNTSYTNTNADFNPGTNSTLINTNTNANNFSNSSNYIITNSTSNVSGTNSNSTLKLTGGETVNSTGNPTTSVTQTNTYNSTIPLVETKPKTATTWVQPTPKNGITASSKNVSWIEPTVNNGITNTTSNTSSTKTNKTEDTFSNPTVSIAPIVVIPNVSIAPTVVIPTKGTNLTKSQLLADKNAQIIDSYLRKQDISKLGSNPTLNNVQRITIDGVTTYFYNYTNEYNKEYRYTVVMGSDGQPIVKNVSVTQHTTSASASFQNKHQYSKENKFRHQIRSLHKDD